MSFIYLHSHNIFVLANIVFSYIHYVDKKVKLWT